MADFNTQERLKTGIIDEKAYGAIIHTGLDVSYCLNSSQGLYRG